MRRMLGILGERATRPGADAGDAAASRCPGLDRLGELVEQVRAAGLPVELSVEGERRPLDAGIELSAYRIVQEALTNALKHARGARAPGRTSATSPRRSRSRSTDEGGTGRRDLGDGRAEGRGLIGMRERAALFGGAARGRPDPDAASASRARLPLEPRSGGAADERSIRVLLVDDQAAGPDRASG